MQLVLADSSGFWSLQIIMDPNDIKFYKIAPKSLPFSNVTLSPLFHFPRQKALKNQRNQMNIH